MRRPPPAVTVALGALVSLVALVGSTVLVLALHPSSAVRILIVAGALILAVIGGVMMLKDLTP